MRERERERESVTFSKLNEVDPRVAFHVEQNLGYNFEKKKSSPV
jgi:hypothetical protein